jgi:hypothetical protein
MRSYIDLGDSATAGVALAQNDERCFYTEFVPSLGGGMEVNYD